MIVYCVCILFFTCFHRNDIFLGQFQVVTEYRNQQKYTPSRNLTTRTAKQNTYQIQVFKISIITAVSR